MGDNWFEYGDFVVQNCLQEAANLTPAWPSHILNVNNTKMYQIIFARVRTEDNSYLPPHTIIARQKID